MTRELDSHKLEEERGGTRGKWAEWMGGGGLAENHLKQGKQMKEVGRGGGAVCCQRIQHETRKEKNRQHLIFTTPQAWWHQHCASVYVSLYVC